MEDKSNVAEGGGGNITVPLKRCFVVKCIDRAHFTSSDLELQPDLLLTELVFKLINLVIFSEFVCMRLVQFLYSKFKKRKSYHRSFFGILPKVN